MLTNLEVLSVTSTYITGPLPSEYADYMAVRKVAVRAAAAAAAAATRARAAAERSKRALGHPVTRSSDNSSLDADTYRAQRTRAVTYFNTAQRRAAVAQKVAQAVQAAASNGTRGRSSSGLGMLKLRQLLLNDNKLSGSLPVQYAQMRDLQVRGMSQPHSHRQL